MKREEKKILKFNFFQYLKNSYKIQTTFHQYQKLYSTPPWHGARTCKVSRKYINAFLSYSAKTKRDWRTDGRTDGGRCNISRPGPSAPREIKISNKYFGQCLAKICHWSSDSATAEVNQICLYMTWQFVSQSYQSHNTSKAVIVYSCQDQP